VPKSGFGSPSFPDALFTGMKDPYHKVPQGQRKIFSTHSRVGTYSRRQPGLTIGGIRSTNSLVVLRLLAAKAGSGWSAPSRR